MTTELQRAMAQYEEARIHYKTTVLASLNGSSNGDAVRQAIRYVQRTSADLKRLQGEPPRPPMKPPVEVVAFPGSGLVFRLLKAG